MINRNDNRKQPHTGGSNSAKTEFAQNLLKVKKPEKKRQEKVKTSKLENG